MATFLKGDIHGNLFEIIDFINRFNLGKNDNIIRRLWNCLEKR